MKMNQIGTHAHTLMHESIEQETIDMSKMTVALQPLNAFPPAIQMHRAQCQNRESACECVCAMQFRIKTDTHRAITSTGI